MEEKDIHDLLKYLADHGFQGKDLEAALIARIRSGLPEFSIDHRINFNYQKELTVSYRLNFKMNHQVGAYLFDRNQASCITPPKIENEQYDAINTIELDWQMSQVHWELYFKGGTVTGADNQGMAQQCIEKINLLLRSNENDQIGFARMMMFKHWPKEQLGSDWVSSYNARFQRERDFSNEVHANLAYHLLTGQLDALYEKVVDTGMDMVSRYDLYNALSDHLESNSDSFSLHADFFQQDCQGSVQLFIFNSGNAYEVGRQSISLTRHPAIDHKVINGIDTAALETEMAAVNWKNDHELFIFREDDVPDFKPKAEAIFKQMNSIKDDPDGQKIYDLLSLRYWADSTFFENFICERAWDFSASLPKHEMDLPPGMEIRLGINLLAGRPIMAHLVDKSKGASDLWVKLDNNRPPDDPHVYFTGVTKDEVGALVFSLPLMPDLERGIITDLISGERVKTQHKNGRPLLIEADPQNKTLKIFSVDGRLIPVNIHFDPDWQPPSYLVEHSKKERDHLSAGAMKKKPDTSSNLRL
ncbi:hypothetical protein HGH92_29520 [Chitinophaga varians]|uniref:Uncharacterized protein n=1 Tax=Chitinophaga varians TaxID=2202339 RepID=A0A847S9T5_9BACT|nr:hypothetical protein [Chitinophaga varians]NLR68481.1 hypothetical protein [Chitinophaga varians]